MPGLSPVPLGQPGGRRIRAERRICAVLLLLLAAAAPEGDWLTEDRDGVIRIAPCPAPRTANLCGTIIGEVAPAQDVRGQPQCGQEIIHPLTPDGTGIWQGRITDPETGRVYNARITPRDADSLTLRGALDVPVLRDVFGKTQVWTRYNGTIGSGCRMPKSPPG